MAGWISKIGDAVSPFRRIERRLHEWNALNAQLLVYGIDVVYAEHECHLIPAAKRLRPRSCFNGIVGHRRFERKADVPRRKFGKGRRLVPIPDLKTDDISVK